jgi:hypothetical protein
MIHLPHGFTPVTLEKMLYHFSHPSPSLGFELFKHVRSQVGNLSEEDLAKQIIVLETKRLVQFSIGPDNDPSVFIAPSTAYATTEERKLADSIVSFWDVQGKFDAVHGRIESAESWVVRVKTPEGEIAIIESVAQKLRQKNLLTLGEDGFYHGPSKAQVIAWTEQHGVCDFCSDPTPLYVEDVAGFDFMPGYTSEGGWATCETCHRFVTENRRADLLKRGLSSSRLGGEIGAQAQGELHRRFWQAMDAKKQPKLPPSKQPHWQEALDQKMNAIYKLKPLVQYMTNPPESAPEKDHVSLQDMQEDFSALQAAEVFSFNADTMHAIMTASESIPHESSLKSVEVPSVRAGWFWFADPYPTASAPVSSDVTHALLWSWSTYTDTPTLLFSTYVIDEKAVSGQRGQIWPATKWEWPLDATFHEMILKTTLKYRHAYGKGGPLENTDKRLLVGEKATLLVVAELSLFFLQACSWFRQTVPGTKKKIEPKLTQEQPHVERHLRRRHERDFSIKPKVHVIALRKSAAEPAEPSEQADGTKRHLSVRFVVRGHNRLQPCGPGRMDKKLIWIDSYPKGPDDAPFKPPSDRVYAVIR